MALKIKGSLSGRVRCLGPNCNRWFESPDRFCVRICPACKKKAGREYMPARVSGCVYVKGRRVSLEE